MPVRQLAAIMFADITGYTALMQSNENKAKELRDKHRMVIEDRVAAHAGEIIQYYGDGVLCIFGSAKEAVAGAHEIQRALLTEPVVPHRIGLHLGDIVRDETNIYGDGVNIASRIESLAIPGSVLLSDKIRLELENDPGIRTKSLGKFQLKNVKRSIEIFALDHEDIKVPEVGDLQSNVAQRSSKCIAIMPFTCLEGSEEGSYVADGLPEEIAAGLSKIDGLSIISRTTALAIKNSNENPLEVARRLNVTHLLEGSVRRAGSQVRVSVQLISTADGYQVWSETFRGTLDNIFDLQDDIANHVMSAMRVNVDPGGKTQARLEQPTLNPQAHQLYLKGLHHWNKRDPESVSKASEFFNEALAIDPEYSSAQCAISHCYAFLGSYGTLPPTDAYAKALHFAMKAIENNPKNAEAHLAIASVKFHHYWDWTGAKASLDKAASLGLSSALLHQSYGLYYAAMGDIALGIEKMQQAVDLDPLSMPVMNMLGTLYIFGGQFDQAIRVFDEILELEPTFRSALQYKGMALLSKGNLEEALDALTRYHGMVNHPQKGISILILCYHAMGDRVHVTEYLDRIYARFEDEPTAAVEIDLAIAHGGMGDYDKAVEFLERVYEKRFSVACLGMIWMMRCQYFKGLWETPGYKKLLARMGVSA